jgi:5-dehydro-4-deoxyglucarate dehydratase
MTIVVSGGLGELFTLGVEEHRQLVAAAVAGAEGRMPVVAGVGGSYRNTLDMAKNAQAAGADAIFIFAYPFACDNTEGCYQYLHDIAQSVEIGTMAYPCGTNDFRVDVLKRLATLPSFIGFKDSSGDVEVGQALGSIVGDEFLWVAEGEAHAEKTLPAGGQAYTTAVATFAPQACHEFWQEGVSGNSERMQTVNTNRIAPVVKLRQVKPGYGISGIKVALEALGRAGGPVRPPGTQVEAEDRPMIAAIARESAETL